MIDCHVHTNYAIDAPMSIEEAAAKAAALGLDYMCFTQHLELTHLKPGEVGMSPALMGEYFRRVEKAREEYGAPLGTGLEVGYVRNRAADVERLLGEYPFDFIIGSVHETMPNIMLTGSEGIEKMRRRGAENVVNDYFDEVEEMIGLGCFDVLGHLDVVNKYGERAFGRDIYPLYRERALEAGKLLKKAGKGFEVNSQGIRRIGRSWPRQELITALHGIGITTVTYGSDAHEPDQIAYGWAESVAALRKAGYEELSYFEQRKRKGYKIGKKG